MSKSSVAIIGAGLAGSLLSIYLAKRGFEVEVYEARGDMRLETVEAGRSINLALSDRGIAALREVGMDEYMLNEAVPMHGRMIHSPAGEQKLLPYSGRIGEYINSVSRSGLNIALMNEAERYDGVRFNFNKRCVDIDIETGDALFEDGSTVNGATVIATDGAGSPVRQAMQRRLPDFQYSSVFLDHGYKELHIPPAPGGGFLLEKNALHIWPRHQFMMIALPNFDGSFTCTLFLAHRTNAESTARAFDRLTDDKSVRGFFEREFSGAVPLMPMLVDDFFGNPIGQLGTVKCWPWHVGGKALLLGDSAHAVVPFYGQGMNCSFEDVRVLASLIDDQIPDPNPHSAFRDPQSIDWATVYREYGELRKVNTDAIADLAEENFYEMRDATADPVFQRKRELETKLEQTYPDYFSKYSMVTFREDMPYSIAKAKGNAQDDILMEICAGVGSVDQIDIADVMEKVKHV